MDQGGRDGRENALQLHRTGQLGPARAAYEALLANAPEDADLLGLAGLLALQEERTGDAEALFVRSLAAGGEARIHRRNLSNYLVLLKEARRDEDRCHERRNRRPRARRGPGGGTLRGFPGPRARRSRARDRRREPPATNV